MALSYLWLQLQVNCIADLTRKAAGVYCLSASVYCITSQVPPTTPLTLTLSPPMLYKLVLVPTPILHTNFHENSLTTFGIPRHLKII